MNAGLHWQRRLWRFATAPFQRRTYSPRLIRPERSAGPDLTTSATASAPSMFVANRMPTPQWSLQKCSRVSAAQVLVVRVRALPRCTAHMRCGGARCITVGAQAGATACQALQPRRRQHTPSSWKLPRSTSSRSTRGPRGAPCLRTRSAKGVQKYQQK